MKVGTGWLYRHLRGVKSSFVKIDFVFQPGFQAGKKIGPSFCFAPEPVNAGFIINPAFFSNRDKCPEKKKKKGSA